MFMISVINILPIVSADEDNPQPPAASINSSTVQTNPPEHQVVQTECHTNPQTSMPIQQNIPEPSPFKKGWRSPLNERRRLPNLNAFKSQFER